MYGPTEQELQEDGGTGESLERREQKLHEKSEDLPRAIPRGAGNPFSLPSQQEGYKFSQVVGGCQAVGRDLFSCPSSKLPEHIPAPPMPRKAPAGTVARAVLAAAQTPTPAFGLCTGGSRTLLRCLCPRCFRFPSAAVEREHW